MNILEIVNLKKHYAAQKAVDGISFSIGEGNIFGLLGPNGAGKTTLIRMITGIFFPDEGNILFKGNPFEPLRDASAIGYMPEERGLYKKMKIGEQAVYLARLKGLTRSQALERAKEWFARLEMDNWWNKKVEELSKGMSQKLQFVITVLHQPSLIILDEPFSGLDPVNANLIKEEILLLAKKGSSIIFSTHRMEQVEEICDHIVLMNKGKKILDGAVTNIKRQFKENLFALTLEKMTPLSAAPSFDLVRNEEGKIMIRITEGCRPHEALQNLLDQGAAVTGFYEILPSLNDIFIRLVEGTPQKINASL
ncbi:MAG TPA: ATP-binding cassette domain-containing protein [Flavitalea sp.]|nr:ATP-binding cassette domain-containing protein [Flavitalea sp.]